MKLHPGSRPGSGYNHSVKSLALTVCGCLFGLALGCSKSGNENEPIRQAVLDYLAKRGNLNVGSMDVKVVAVTFANEQAEATVSFRAKGAGVGSPEMTMHYALARQGGRWVVKGRTDSGPSAHGAEVKPSSQLPPGHPPLETSPPGNQK